MKKLVFLVTVIIFTSLTVAFGADLYVSPGGSGTLCTQASPCSFQQALTTAESNAQNDTIYVTAGTYNISSTLTYETTDGDGGHTLTIQGAGAGSTVLEGTFLVPLSITTDADGDGGDTGGDVSISGITFQNRV